jgi:enoyl-CoA hydratase
MTDAEPVFLEMHADGVALVTFNRPGARNALNLAAMARFAAIVDDLSRDQSLRAVVLTGAGSEAFCAGGDLIELADKPSEADARAFITQMGDALALLEALPVPVIAAINGYALGGGSEIAVACDFRVVDEVARLGFVQITLGLTPGWGAGQRLLRLVGYAAAMRLLLEAPVLTAGELHAMGLADAVVPAGHALPHAMAMAGRMAAKPPAVVRAVKSLLRAGLTQPYSEALETERALFPALWAADPHLDAVAEFIQRRKG